VSLEEDFLAMMFYPEINPEQRIPKDLRYGLDMLIAHCNVTGRNELDIDYVLQFLRTTPYSSSAKSFKPNYLMKSFSA
jgi:hypothetical protein